MYNVRKLPYMCRQVLDSCPVFSGHKHDKVKFSRTSSICGSFHPNSRFCVKCWKVKKLSPVENPGPLDPSENRTFMSEKSEREWKIAFELGKRMTLKAFQNLLLGTQLLATAPQKVTSNFTKSPWTFSLSA